jgi:hypothetical protein
MILDDWHAVFWPKVEDGQRRGQAMMNALQEIAPEIAESLTDTQYDVFYTTDEDLTAEVYVAWLEEVWRRGLGTPEQ